MQGRVYLNNVTLTPKTIKAGGGGRDSTIPIATIVLTVEDADPQETADLMRLGHAQVDLIVEPIAYQPDLPGLEGEREVLPHG